MKIRVRFLATALAVASLISLIVPGVGAQGGGILVISQIYGAGGNSGALFNRDYVELFNRGTGPVDLTGLSVQYTSAAGTGNFGTPAALSGTLQAGQYYLVGMTIGANGAATPTPDATGTIAMAAGAGKVALVNQTTALACNGGSTPCSAAQLALIIDLVGYGPGTGGANFFEGSGPAPTIGTTTADFRALHGCQDTNNNAGDFAAATPAARNTASALAACSAPTNPSVSGSANPSNVEQGQSFTLTAGVTPGANPVSTGLQVTADLSSLGGPAIQSLLDDGVAPDTAAGDNVFTATVAVPPATSLGTHDVPLSVQDAQSRSGSSTLTVTVIPPPTISLPHEIQGPGLFSPFPNGITVTVRGVVTARKFNGFFLQTQVGLEDADPDSSEGLFIFTSTAPPATVIVGHLAQVTGRVSEFVRAGEPGSQTEISNVTTILDQGLAALPDPVTLTADDVSPAGTIDQLERFEGMRVFIASLTAISGTDGIVTESSATSVSDGTFFAIVTGVVRPFREPGVEAGYEVLPCAAGPCNVPLFDGNPERLKVDSDALEGTAKADVSTGAVMINVTGPLDFDHGNYILEPEVTLAPVGGMTATAVPAAGPNQFTVASFNMERFFDTINDPNGDAVLTPAAYANRLNKASLAIRTILNTPDIVGVEEVEKLAVLQDIANKVNADSGAVSPQYVPYLFEGNDQGGIDVGFLVKTAGGRVTVDTVEQLGLDTTFTFNGATAILNDRPPVMLRATLQGPATSLPQHITVFVNHLRSLLGITDPLDGPRVRAKRAAQAEFLADLIQTRQANDPSEAIVTVGDYNAFSFNDGYGDSMGTIRGTPAPPQEVATASPDLVNPDLVDLADLIPQPDRYSYVFNGNAQTLDHVVATANLVPQFAALVHGRVNADFAEVLRSDPNRPERLSDHDPVVAYFTFPADTIAPEFGFLPADQTAAAVDASGAPVTYPLPTATDNLDGSVPVDCAPASGSVFPLGNTAVTCTAEDANHNVASAIFTVSVIDDAPPVLSVPADITIQAAGPGGEVVTFVVTASDNVTAAPTISCSPASGSTFVVGTTNVTCAAMDAAGNPSVPGSFTVTVTPPQPGRMIGAGAVDTGGRRASFIFEVSDSMQFTEKGALTLRVPDRPGRPDRYLAAHVVRARFTNAPGTGPGPRPKSGIDTVEFSGVGSWNGADGFTFDVIASDRGEPGRGSDTFEIVVHEPGGAVVASFAGTLSIGNIQSLRPARR